MLCLHARCGDAMPRPPQLLSSSAPVRAKMPSARYAVCAIFCECGGVRPAAMPGATASETRTRCGDAGGCVAIRAHHFLIVRSAARSDVYRAFSAALRHAISEIVVYAVCYARVASARFSYVCDTRPDVLLCACSAMRVVCRCYERRRTHIS